MVEVRAGTLADIEGASHCVGVVASERAYIGFLEGPSLEQSRVFWTGLIDAGHPFVVAVDGPTVQMRTPFRSRMSPLASSRSMK